MKIVEIPSFFPPYGGEFCLEQSNALASLGHEITIIANVQLSIKKSVSDFFFTPYNRRKLVVGGLNVYRSDMRGVPRSAKYNAKRWIKIVRQMFKQYVAENGKPDIIHAHCAKWAGYAASLISKEYSIPFVITEHLPSMIFKTEFGEDISRLWQIPLLKSAYKSADRVIPVSPELVDDLEQYFGRDYKWTYISNTIDVDFFHFQTRTPLNDRNYRFCCLALYIPRKGYDVLIHAFDLLANKNPNVELFIAGRFTDNSDCLKLINSSAFSQKITVCGELDKENVRKLLYHCDCLVLATRNESQGLVLLEAMSTGIPVISTDSVPSNVRIENGCTIVPTDDAIQMSETMFKMCFVNNYDGKLISSKVANLASPQTIGKKLESLFTEVISARH